MNTKLASLLSIACVGALVATAAESPATSLLVLNKGDQTLAIVDPNSLRVVGRAPAGPDPHEVIASADGRLAFISNYGSHHTLSVVDLVDQKPLPAVELGALLSPHGLAEANGKIFFTAEGSKVIGSYDPKSEKIDWVLGLGQDRTHMIVVSKNADRIFTSNVNSDTVSFIEKSSGPGGRGPAGWNETHIHVGDGPEGFDVSPDGRELWAANSHDGTVSVIDVAKKAVVDTLKTRVGFSNRLKFTPDGKRVFISDLRGNDLDVLDTDTRKEIKAIDLGGGSAGILVQPDGARAYVSVGSRNGVVVIDLKTLEPAGFIESGPGPDGLAWAVRK